MYTTLYDLTFVDLPGITKVPVGDQPEDINEQIQELIMKYVKPSNSIILAVVTANTDPSSSESLKIARNVDPNGERTIAVVTKLDLIDKGTLQDATELLCGHKIPVKLGIIGVVNKSQMDINDNKSMIDTLKSEREFLRTNYPKIYQKHRNNVLANTLQTLLINHIQKTLPQVYQTLKNTKNRLENELKNLKTPDSKMSFILGLLKDISKSYCDTIQGNRKDISDEYVIDGAKINEIVKNYVDQINSIQPLLNLNKSQIGTILMNTSGTRNNSFVNEKALEIMIGKQLEYLKEPSSTIVDVVSAEMFKEFDSVDSNLLDILKRYPMINSDVRVVLKKLLDDQVKSIKDFINSYIETHQDCLNTTNPDFFLQLVKLSTDMQDNFIASFSKTRTNINSNFDKVTIKGNVNNTCKKIPFENVGFTEYIITQRFKQMLTGLNDLDETMETSKQVKMHENITSCYFDFIRKNIRDFLPKRIQHKMVNFILNELDKPFNEHVFTPYVINKCIDKVMAEENSVIEDRLQSEKLLDAVNKALISLMDI